MNYRHNPRPQRYGSGINFKGALKASEPVLKGAAQFAAPILADVAKSYLKQQLVGPGAGVAIPAVHKDLEAMKLGKHPYQPTIQAKKVYTASGGGTYKYVRT